jgi:hypothetical protein
LYRFSSSFCLHWFSFLIFFFFLLVLGSFYLIESYWI